MTLWDEYFARYRDLSDWSRVDDDERTVTEEGLVADFSAHYPPSTQEDINWFLNALNDDQRKYFVAFVLQDARKVPEFLYEPMMRAAIRDRDPSRDRVFVEPCVATFGLRRVNETLLVWFEDPPDQEKAGAVQAMHWAVLINVRDSDRKQPGVDVVFGAIEDLWMRQRCLREFVKNPGVLVRQRIIPHLNLVNGSSYPEQFRSLVPEAIQIARNYPDAYIRHRLEVRQGSNETQPFSSLPATPE